MWAQNLSCRGGRRGQRGGGREQDGLQEVGDVGGGPQRADTATQALRACSAWTCPAKSDSQSNALSAPEYAFRTSVSREADPTPADSGDTKEGAGTRGLSGAEGAALADCGPHGVGGSHCAKKPKSRFSI